MLHAINSHVLTSTNPCINKAIHVLLMHGFAVLRKRIPGPSKKTDVIISKVHSSDDISLCPGNSIFKTFAGDMHSFRAIIVTGKKHFLKQFLQRFRAKKCFMQ